MNLRRGFVCEAFPGSVWGFALLRRKFGIEFKRHLVLEKPFLNLNPLKDTPVHGAHFQSTPCEFDFDRSHVPPWIFRRIWIHDCGFWKFCVTFASLSQGNPVWIRNCPAAV